MSSRNMTSSAIMQFRALKMFQPPMLRRWYMGGGSVVNRVHVVVKIDSKGWMLIYGQIGNRLSVPTVEQICGGVGHE